MKQLMLFPYTQKAYPVLQFADYIKDAQIVALVQLEGWGRKGEIHNVLGRQLIVSEDIDRGLAESDVLCVVKTHLAISMTKWVFPVIKKALSLGKEVWMFTSISREESVVLEEMDKRRMIRYFGKSTPQTSTKYSPVSIPVISVAGTVTNVEKWPVQLSLKFAFERLGYNVLHIGNRKENFLFGGECIPDYFFEPGYTETEKIKAFNFYVASLVSTKKPDLILMGLPGCVVTFEPTLVEDFGVVSFELSQAIPPDEIVLCSMSQKYGRNYFECVSKLIEDRLGVSVCAHHLAPVTFDVTYMQENNSISFLTLDKMFTDELISEINVPSLNDYTKRDAADFLCSRLVEQFGEYGSLQVQT